MINFCSFFSLVIGKFWGIWYSPASWSKLDIVVGRAHNTLEYSLTRHISPKYYPNYSRNYAMKIKLLTEVMYR